MFNKINNKSYRNGDNGVTVYGNKKVIFTENWSGVLMGTDPQTNLKNYLNTSFVEITNCCKYNGQYFANYKNTENFNNGKQKELVVYYVNSKTGKTLKVIYSHDFKKVRFC